MRRRNKPIFTRLELNQRPITFDTSSNPHAEPHVVRREPALLNKSVSAPPTRGGPAEGFNRPAGRKMFRNDAESPLDFLEIEHG